MQAFLDLELPAQSELRSGATGCLLRRYEPALQQRTKNRRRFPRLTAWHCLQPWHTV